MPSPKIVSHVIHPDVDGPSTPPAVRRPGGDRGPGAGRGEHFRAKQLQKHQPCFGDSIFLPRTH